MFIQFKCVQGVLKGVAPTEVWLVSLCMPNQILHGRQWIGPYLACKLRHNFVCSIISVTQYDDKNTIFNSKMHCKPKYTIQLQQS